MADGKVFPPGAGDVILELGENKLVLKPTLQAALAISRNAGGIRGAIDKVIAVDLDTIMTIVRLGVGPREAKRYPNLEEMVYQNGLLTDEGALLARVVEYLSNLSRGGRPASDGADADQKEGGDEMDPPK